MTSDFYFTATSWFPGNVCVQSSGGGGWGWGYGPASQDLALLDRTGPFPACAVAFVWFHFRLFIMGKRRHIVLSYIAPQVFPLLVTEYNLSFWCEVLLLGDAIFFWFFCYIHLVCLESFLLHVRCRCFHKKKEERISKFLVQLLLQISKWEFCRNL